jgi:zinc/manganese transport system substrate-binding protein
MAGARHKRVRRRAVLGALAVPTVGWMAPSYGAPRPISVVATFSILRDMVASVCGGRATVRSLVGRNGDTHNYQLRPSDAQAVATATLLVSNGLGFESWLPRLVEAAAFKGCHVVASAGVEPLMRASESGGAATVPDPHCRQDVACARRYVVNIADGLKVVDAANADRYAEQAAACDKRLAALDAWIRAEIDGVPAGQRRVITDHDAFGYFARAYGVEFLSLRGRLPESEPPAKRVAELIAKVREHKVRALFFENMNSRALIEQIARDSAAVIGAELYSDALSELGGSASTYEAMMRHNVTALIAGMRLNRG